jgi:hypothetical protein
MNRSPEVHSVPEIVGLGIDDELAVRRANARRPATGPSDTSTPPSPTPPSHPRHAHVLPEYAEPWNHVKISYEGECDDTAAREKPSLG